jgi:hypothetical protein
MVIADSAFSDWPFSRLRAEAGTTPPTALNT